MSAEAFDPSAPETVIELFGPEALIARRTRLHHRMGELSALLCDVTQDYNDCIREIIETNTALREAGVDTDTLARHLQALQHDS